MAVRPNTLSFITTTLKTAGQMSLEAFGKARVAYTKQDPSDVVTKTDLAIEKYIVKAIGQKFPKDSILSEEGDDIDQDGNWLWILDPIDGTRNFASQTPLYGVMLAVAHQGELQATGIYLPYVDELYTAEVGKGAKLNGKKISCSDQKDWSYSFGCSTVNMRGRKAEFVRALVAGAKKNPFWMSGFGSTAVSSAFTAAGRRDWYASIGAQVWDYAPTVLLLRESGCIVTNRNGEHWQIGDTSLVAANKHLHSKLLKTLQQVH